MPRADHDMFFQGSPGPRVQLDENARPRLPAAMDPDALEELLAWTRPEYRGGHPELLFAIGEPKSTALGEASSHVEHPEVNRFVKRLKRR